MTHPSTRPTVALITLTLFVFSLIAIVPVQAGPRDQPPPLAGWTHSPRYPDDTAQQHGIVLSGAAIERVSPVIAEVDGNTSNGKEVVVGGKDGRVYVYKADGSLLWQKDVPIVGCANFSLINGRATVGTLYGGSTPYVLIGYGSIESSNRVCDGGVVAYRGSDGSQAWNFSQKTYDDTVTPEGPENQYGVITAPALADTDGDGKLEVAFGGLDRNVYLLSHDGSVRWYYHAADTVWSTPLFMNVDGDAALEVVVATDISANPNVIPPTTDGGFLQAFDTQQRTPTRIEFQTGFIWRTSFDQVLYSSPLAADLLDSNAGDEIAIGSGCYFPVGNPNKVGKWIKIVKPSDGTVLQTLNAPACVQSSPATGDIDGDGKLEITATVSGDASIGGDGKSDIVAWDPENANPKWSTSPGDANSGTNDSFGGDLQSTVIADLDGNGSLEVIAANFWSVHVLRGDTGAPLTCQNNSTCGGQISLFAWGTLKSTPAVGDINDDGKLDLVIGGTNSAYNPNKGHLYAWTDFAGKLNSPSGTQNAYSAPWPQFRRDALASGIFTKPGIKPSSTSVGAILLTNQTKQFNVSIDSADSSAFTWTASETSDPNNILSLVNTTGPAGNALQITIDSTGKPNGSYSAKIQVTAPNLPAVEINVQLTVADNVVNVVLPLVAR
jgi:hypothetical protein